MQWYTYTQVQVCTSHNSKIWYYTKHTHFSMDPVFTETPFTLVINFRTKRTTTTPLVADTNIPYCAFILSVSSIAFNIARLVCVQWYTHTQVQVDCKIGYIVHNYIIYYVCMSTSIYKSQFQDLVLHKTHTLFNGPSFTETPFTLVINFKETKSTTTTPLVADTNTPYCAFILSVSSIICGHQLRGILSISRSRQYIAVH